MFTFHVAVAWIQEQLEGEFQFDLSIIRYLKSRSHTHIDE